MATDLHAYYLPPALVAQLRLRQLAPRIEAAGASERLVMPIGTLAFSKQYVDPALRLALMDRAGVKRQMLSLPGLFGVDSLPVHEAAPLVRLFNDDCAALCRLHPTRFVGLAALPMADMAAAVAELQRARRELGLAGAILPIDSFTSVQEAQKLQPLFEAGDALGAHFFIHPGRTPHAGPPPVSTRDHEMARRALAVQADVGEAMVTLLLSDFLDPYRNVTVQVANLGGTFPAVVERMDHTAQVRTPGAVLPSSRARRVWVDCASLGRRAIEQAVAVYGADRIVLGAATWPQSA
jgi:predicted TIM-barrel fold metal-dependent hydrolase